MAPAETPDRADPITRRIAIRVVQLRKSRGWNQADLAERMVALRPKWSRSAVVKLETFKRQDLSVADLMALAIVLNVPLPMLVADPRDKEPVPIGENPAGETLYETPWNVLLSMMGRNSIAPVGVDTAPYERYHNSFEVMHSVWEILEATFEIKDRARVSPGDDEASIEQADRIDEQKHRRALFRIETAVGILQRHGVEPPPIQSFVLKRAAELGGFENLLSEVHE